MEDANIDLLFESFNRERIYPLREKGKGQMVLSNYR